MLIFAFSKSFTISRKHSVTAKHKYPDYIWDIVWVNGNESVAVQIQNVVSSIQIRNGAISVLKRDAIPIIDRLVGMAIEKIAEQSGGIN